MAQSIGLDTVADGWRLRAQKRHSARIAYYKTSLVALGAWVRYVNTYDVGRVAANARCRQQDLQGTFVRAYLGELYGMVWCTVVCT